MLSSNAPDLLPRVATDQKTRKVRPQVVGVCLTRGVIVVEQSQIVLLGHASVMNGSIVAQERTVAPRREDRIVIRDQHMFSAAIEEIAEAPVPSMADAEVALREVPPDVVDTGG